MIEEHQREQPSRLRLLGGEGELAGEPDRLAGQVDPARVTGRVDEIEHAQHDGKVAGLVQATPLQGPRHLGGGREVGVAAAEVQEEGVVALLRGGGPRLWLRDRATTDEDNAVRRAAMQAIGPVELRQRRR
jgi:hypothetical protein